MHAQCDKKGKKLEENKIKGKIVKKSHRML